MPELSQPGGLDEVIWNAGRATFLDSVGNDLMIDNFMESVVNSTRWTSVVASNGSIISVSARLELKTSTTLGGLANLQGNLTHLARNTFGVNSRFNKKILEFGFQSAGGAITDVDETITILGWGLSKASDRSSNNVAGIIIDGGVFKFLTDAGGAEQLTDISGSLGWGDSKVIRIEDTATGFYLYINNVLVASHETQNPNIGNIIIQLKNDTTTNIQFSIRSIVSRYEI